ncbi:MAG: DbpA RNA binding domain-containing protein [Bradymonadaceae bacterium]
MRRTDDANEQLLFPSDLRELLDGEPTALQAETVPTVLAGLDAVVQSDDADEAIAALALGLISRVEPATGALEAVVATPDSATAARVGDAIDALDAPSSPDVAVLGQGDDFDRELDRAHDALILVAPVDRLVGLAERDELEVADVQVAALVGVDEIIESELRDELEELADHLPEDPQTVVFTQIVGERLLEVARRLTYSPEFVGFSETSFSAQNAEHVYYRTRGPRRRQNLARLLEYTNPQAAVLFAENAKTASTLVDFLDDWGFEIGELTASDPVEKRRETLDELVDGSLPIAVATDSGVEDLSLADVSTIVHYRLPKPDVYVDRTDALGRIGREGTSLCLMSPDEIGRLLELRTQYGFDLQEESLPSTEDVVEVRESDAVLQLANRLADLETLAPGAKLGMAERLLSGEADVNEPEQYVARLMALADRVLSDDRLRSWVDATPGEEQIPAPTSESTASPEPAPSAEPEPAEPSQSAPEPSGTEPNEPEVHQEPAPSAPTAPPADPEPEYVDPIAEGLDMLPDDEQGDFSMSKMYMDAGDDQFDGPEDLLETLCHISGMGREDFGDIVVKDHYSFIEVREDYFYDVINTLDGHSLDGEQLTAEPARS